MVKPADLQPSMVATAFLPLLLRLLLDVVRLAAGHQACRLQSLLGQQPALCRHLSRYRGCPQMFV